MIRSHYLAWIAVLAAAVPAAALEPGGDVSVAEDLLAVLTLRGKPCGGIVSHRRLGEADYAVACRDGSRYRIRVDAEERILVEETRVADPD